MNKQRGKLMQDHVKERATGFAEWLDDNKWIRDEGLNPLTGEKMWIRATNGLPETKSITDLYNEYITWYYKT